MNVSTATYLPRPTASQARAFVDFKNELAFSAEAYSYGRSCGRRLDARRKHTVLGDLLRIEMFDDWLPAYRENQKDRRWCLVKADWSTDSTPIVIGVSSVPAVVERRRAPLHL